MKRILLFTLSILISIFIILFVPLAIFIKPFLPYTNYLLGIDKPVKYLVLLGNDTEMRANGGFAGSYAKLTLSYPSPLPALRSFSEVGSREGGRQAERVDTQPRGISLDFQDIYVPNGQLDGHVTPPKPIQEAFGHGTWELANADWEPDFPTAAATIRWFLTKGHEEDPDILAIINLSTIKKVLDIVGPFPVPEYHATITPENLYLFLQGKSEIDFFPGSTQKKDALQTVGKSLFNQIQNISLIQKIKIAHLLYSDLVNQNILLNSTNLSFQDLLNQKNFSGVLKPIAFDSYSLVETNLGANKANTYVTRQTTHQITLSSPPPLPALSREGGRQAERVEHHVSVTFHNSSPQENPNPPFQYGGNYLAYLRFYIPSIAQSIQVTHHDTSDTIHRNGGDILTPPPADNIFTPQINQKYGFTEIGFWHITNAGTQSSVDLSYDLPLANQKDYQLAILKQHGLVTSPQEINLFGKSYSLPLIHSLILP